METILYRIKDYKDGTLFVEDCYRPVPDFSSKRFIYTIINKKWKEVKDRRK